MLARHIRRVYNTIIRPRTPRKIAVFNGIPVRAVRLFDMTDEIPDYEGALVTGIQTRVAPGDDVVIVGGGRGVSSVAAAHRAGLEGSVTAYEGSKERYELAVETIGLNEVDDTVKLLHAIVEQAVDLADSAGGAKTVASADLPKCDVLVLDCEGAEIEILRSIQQRPEILIVETHGFLDSPEADVRATLDDLEYEVVNRGVEAEEMGVYVLTAIKRC